ncbi:MAG: hypothetical protein IEMM0008_0713 [bacterium]|nr:MAG: hypothetical protein IEMM0008_0713 [bacterium]
MSRASEKDLKATQRWLKSLGKKYTLNEIKNLQELDLQRTKVTDTGLVHLKALTSLRELSFMSTQVTDVAVKDLQKALPGCRISK